MLDLNNTRYRIVISDVTPKNSFPNTNKPSLCFIGVSFENPNFQIKYLPTILKWVEANFDHCSIIIADYLFRHSLKITQGLSDKQAIDIALKQGKETYDTYKKIIPQSPQFTIYRWLDEQMFINEDYIESFKNTCYKNKLVLEDIDADCLAYLRRKELKAINKSLLTESERLELCRKYIIEEMAFINHQADQGIRCSVYPGTQLTVLKNFSLNKYPDCNLALKEMIYFDLKIKK